MGTRPKLGLMPATPWLVGALAVVLVFAERERRVAVLPESRVVVAARGVSIEVGDRALPRPYAPGDPFDPENEDAPELGEEAWEKREARALEPNEREELVRLAGERRKVSWAAVAPTILAVLAVLSVVRDGPSKGRVALAVVWCLVAAGAWAAQRARRRSAGALVADATGGEVWRITSGPLEGHEVLPGTKAPWSTPHGPAPWRVGR